MPQYPLILTLTFDVRCADFSARVVAHGRALMALEDECWWCHGVDPGGISAHGDTPPAAFVGYKQAFLDVLGDLAREAGSFDRFEKAVRSFVHDTDKNELDRWQDARSDIRSGNAVDGPFQGLKRVTGTVIINVSVETLDKVEASKEVVELAKLDSKAA